MWLRILGRGKVQSQAIDELEALPKDNPQRENA
ncbi:MAG: flagellar assembly protein H, partial [Okeania sp. SIO2D1]|nr:flagellar assembly protein H [Okeania sp. SIO2D1]